MPEQTTEQLPTLSAVPPVPTEEQMKLFKSANLDLHKRASITRALMRVLRERAMPQLYADAYILTTKCEMYLLGKHFRSWNSLPQEHVSVSVDHLYIDVPWADPKKYGQARVRLVFGKARHAMPAMAHNWGVLSFMRGDPDADRLRDALLDYHERYSKTDKELSAIGESLVVTLNGRRNLADAIAAVPDLFEILGEKVLFQIAPPKDRARNQLAVSNKQLHCAIGRIMGVERDSCKPEEKTEDSVIAL